LVVQRKSGKKVTIDLHCWPYNQVRLLQAIHQRLDDEVQDFIDACALQGRESFKFQYIIPMSDNSRPVVFGQLFYLPFKNDVEQRPRLPDVAENEFSDACMIRCYWQNRLVPGSTLKDLHFFGGAWQQWGISNKWRKRILGILWFDWNYYDIANNKLKFNSNVETTLKDGANVEFNIADRNNTFRG
jgi:hypothetical protein